MRTLHIFNPEHEIALAANLTNFTAPHAGRQLRADLGWLPAFWAKPDDAVLVGDVDYASRLFRRINAHCHLGLQEPEWTENGLEHMDISRIDAWGWDAALRHQLFAKGLDEQLLPSESLIEEWRQTAHRRTAAKLLAQLRIEGTVGEAVECQSINQVTNLERLWQRVVVKSPWSSSGRGVRFCLQDGWLRNVLARQGSVMVEPYYNKVKDFAMEFEADGHGGIRFLGLSLFHTKNGAYIGNIVATEQTKRQLLSKLLPLELTDEVCRLIVTESRLGSYQGPFGVDMMVVTDGQRLLLHPCVEINLRRTMGHVALALQPQDDEVMKVMRIELTDHYKLRINKI